MLLALGLAAARAAARAQASVRHLWLAATLAAIAAAADRDARGTGCDNPVPAKYAAGIPMSEGWFFRLKAETTGLERVEAAD